MKLQAKFLFDPFGSQWGKSSKILKRFFSQAFPYFTSNLFHLSPKAFSLFFQEWFNFFSLMDDNIFTSLQNH